MVNININNNKGLKVIKKMKKTGKINVNIEIEINLLSWLYLEYVFGMAGNILKNSKIEVHMKMEGRCGLALAFTAAV
jgi:hypothetical protein